MTHSTMADIKRRNQANGGHWFDAATMRFFDSRVGQSVYDGRYFISSEQFNSWVPRLYSIREAMPNGDIEEVSAFQQFQTYAQARRAVYRIIQAAPERLIGDDMLHVIDGKRRYRECACGKLASFRTAADTVVCPAHLLDTIDAES